VIRLTTRPSKQRQAPTLARTLPAMKTDGRLHAVRRHVSKVVLAPLA
jgi:hypothetical protein